MTSELVFEDCLLPEENILPTSGGLKSPLMCLTQARYGIAWGAVGAAISCYRAAVEYAKQRVQFDRPIAGFQLTQKKLVEMLTEISKAQLICLRLGRMKDAGELEPVHVSMAKMNNVAMALEFARTRAASSAQTESRAIIRSCGTCATWNLYTPTRERTRCTRLRSANISPVSMHSCRRGTTPWRERGWSENGVSRSRWSLPRCPCRRLARAKFGSEITRRR